MTSVSPNLERMTAIDPEQFPYKTEVDKGPAIESGKKVDGASYYRSWTRTLLEAGYRVKRAERTRPFI